MKQRITMREAVQRAQKVLDDAENRRRQLTQTMTQNHFNTCPEKFEDVLSPQNKLEFKEGMITHLSGYFCSDELREIARIVDIINADPLKRIDTASVKGYSP